MKVLVGCFLVLLRTAFCDVLLITRNNIEGSVCHLRNRTRGVCRRFCDDPDQSWIEFKDDICNPRKQPTLYCCINKQALNYYPTLNEVCSETLLAETMEKGRSKWRETIQNVLVFYDSSIKERADVVKANCMKAALRLEIDERGYFLKTCLRIEEVRAGTLTEVAEYRHLDYPSIVGIGRSFNGGINWTCTGHFIHPLFVLTSASCVKESQTKSGSSISAPPNVIRYGRVDLFDEDFSGDSSRNSFTYDIEEITVLEQYNEETLAGDIALLKVKRNLEQEQKEDLHLKPIPACLWTKESIPAENLTILAYTNILHKGEVSPINPTECAKKLNIEELDKARACYVCNLEDKDPMVASLHYRPNLEIDVPYLVAIGSSKMPCRGQEPAHFTLISPYLKQIEDIVNGN